MGSDSDASPRGEADISIDELLWPDIAHQASGMLAEAHGITFSEARALLRAHAQLPDGRLAPEDLAVLANRVLHREALQPPGPDADGAA